MHALRGINVDIKRGEFVAMMGPSGSGKSTCMNILGCLDVPTGGQYLFEGVDVATLSRNQRALLRRHYIGFVFQGFNLLARTSALENVELPLVYRGTPVAQRRARARRALEQVGLAGWEDHSPSELSGGQQQRVAIARSIVTEPDVLLADEPTGNLDTKNSDAIVEMIKELHASGATLVVITHNLEIAESFPRVIGLRDGQLEAETTVPGDTAQQGAV
jgi:putative ABC transport system ATP-binding protein